MIIKKYHFQTIFSLIKNIKNPHSLWGVVVHPLSLIRLKNNTKFFVRNLMDLWVLTESYINKDYEKFGIPVGRNWTVIDIGAGIGDFSILAAQASSRNKIYAIEPYESSYNLLIRNIKLNKIKNVRTFQIAISSKQKKLGMMINQKNLGNNRIKKYEKSKMFVNAISLEQFMNQNKIDHINLIKSDCEGEEFNIFQNLNRDSYKKIDHIVMEYHLFKSKYMLEKLVDTFRSNGFKIKQTSNPVHKNIGFLFADKD